MCIHENENTHFPDVDCIPLDIHLPSTRIMKIKETKKRKTFLSFHVLHEKFSIKDITVPETVISPEVLNENMIK